MLPKGLGQAQKIFDRVSRRASRRERKAVEVATDRETFARAMADHVAFRLAVMTWREIDADKELTNMSAAWNAWETVRSVGNFRQIPGAITNSPQRLRQLIQDWQSTAAQVA